VTGLEKELTAALEVERARVAQLEDELRSCDCTNQICPDDGVNPNCTTHAALSTSSDEWLREKLAEAERVGRQKGKVATDMFWKMNLALDPPRPEDPDGATAVISAFESRVTAKARAEALRTVQFTVEVEKDVPRGYAPYRWLMIGERRYEPQLDDPEDLAKWLNEAIRSLSASGETAPLPKTRNQAEAWLAEDKSGGGVLAWDRAPKPETAPHECDNGYVFKTVSLGEPLKKVPCPVCNLAPPVCGTCGGSRRVRKAMLGPTALPGDITSEPCPSCGTGKGAKK